MSRAGQLLDALRDAGEIVCDPDILEGYRRDPAAPGLVEAGKPAVLAGPRTAAPSWTWRETWAARSLASTGSAS